MNIEDLRTFCLSLPGTTEDIKWGNDLCFLVGDKMFCVTSADADQGASFKVLEEEFETMTHRPGIIPAPYLARNHWVYVVDFTRLNDREWKHYVQQSYELISAKLPKKVRDALS